MFAIVKSSPLKLLRLQTPWGKCLFVHLFCVASQNFARFLSPGSQGLYSRTTGWEHQTSSNLMLIFNGEIRGLGATKNMKNHPIICIIWHSLADLECVQLWWWMVQLASLSNSRIYSLTSVPFFLVNFPGFWCLHFSSSPLFQHIFTINQTS